MSSTPYRNSSAQMRGFAPGFTKVGLQSETTVLPLDAPGVHAVGAEGCRNRVDTARKSFVLQHTLSRNDVVFGSNITTQVR